MEIVKKDEFKVVGIKITCKEEQLWVEMPKSWKIFRERASEIKNRKDDYLIDMCIERVGDMFTQCICVEVDGHQDIPEGMVEIIIPEQQYIYFKHEEDESKIWESFGNMEKWAKENNYSIDPLEFKMDYSCETKGKNHKLYLKVE